MNVFDFRARYTARPKNPILHGKGYFWKSRLGNTKQWTNSLSAFKKHNAFFGEFFNSKNSHEKNQDKLEVQCNTTHFLYKLHTPTVDD